MDEKTPNTPEKEEFAKLSVKSNVKHEIDIIAATERRFVYEVVEDMLKLYKHVVVGKTPKTRNGKKGAIDYRTLDTKNLRTELKELLTH
jgi:hypothetical protein